MKLPPKITFCIVQKASPSIYNVMPEGRTNAALNIPMGDQTFMGINIRKQSGHFKKATEIKANFKIPDHVCI